MKFCCNNFEGSYYIGNSFGINIRIVKFTSNLLISQSGKTKFFMTMGYDKFSLNLAMVNMNFCPYCGIKLDDFYKNERYANEIEGKTFV